MLIPHFVARRATKAGNCLAKTEVGRKLDDMFRKKARYLKITAERPPIGLHVRLELEWPIRYGNIERFHAAVKAARGVAPQTMLTSNGWEIDLQMEPGQDPASVVHGFCAALANHLKGVLCVDFRDYTNTSASGEPNAVLVYGGHGAFVPTRTPAADPAVAEKEPILA